ncbi:MAG: hypothetical protein ACREAK_07345 [Nitrosarchaeum sp.]
MSSDREEIRWKMQVLSEMMSNMLAEHKNEKEVLNNWLEMRNKSWIELRNTMLTGIGFGIGIWISLISIGIIDKMHAWFIVIGIASGAAIYIGINVYLFKVTKDIIPLVTLYEKQTYELIKLKGWIAGRSMREDVTRDLIELLGAFIVVSSQASVYEARQYVHTKFKEAKKPNQEEFRDGYNIAKNHLDSFQIPGLNEAYSRIESFIKDFEKNDKKKK